MKREEIIRLLENLEVVKAWLDGKTIQARNRHAGVYLEWEDHTRGTPDFGNCFWEWRVKPTPREFWLVCEQSGRIDVYENKPKALKDQEVIHVIEVTP